MPIPQLWDKPITVWLGMVVFTLLWATVAVGILRHKRVVRWPLKYHHYLALATVFMALIHAGFAFAAYFL